MVPRPGDAVLVGSGADNRQSSLVRRRSHDVVGLHAPTFSPPRMVARLELLVLLPNVDVIIGNQIASGGAILYVIRCRSCSDRRASYTDPARLYLHHRRLAPARPGFAVACPCRKRANLRIQSDLHREW